MEPTKFFAGDSVAWGRVVPGFSPADGWELRYAMRGPVAIDFGAVADGAGFRVDLDAERTATWTPGEYRWAAYVQRLGDRQTIAFGDLVVAPDWLAIETIDPRSHARVMLDLIEAALEKRIPKDRESWQVDGMRIDRIPVEKLVALRRQYAREVAAEKRRKRGSPLGLMVKAEM
ncbi:MAG: hypothetical protein VX796_09325 [Pseudomonadota bacterium]|nr:hypothetical protein [Pseudomonadota bacterium]